MTMTLFLIFNTRSPQSLLCVQLCHLLYLMMNTRYASKDDVNRLCIVFALPLHMQV